LVKARFILLAALMPIIAQNSAVFGADAAPITYAVPVETRSYSDIADLVVIAPLIVDAKIRSVKKLPSAQTVGVPENVQRMIVEADVQALIRGNGGITPRVRFLLDLKKDHRGKLPNLNKQRLYLMANYSDTPGNIKLARPDALIQWSPGNETKLRSITQEAVQIDAPAQVTGVINAFHTAGTLIGDGETQIFLGTANKQPMAITVISAQGKPKRWSLSTSELIGESNLTPTPQSLLWYRLACGLPKTLPDSVFESSDADGRAATQSDYSFVIKSLGPCGRQRSVL
jgi:hypothetical protein